MVHKRKSDQISKDEDEIDIVDLTIAYGLEEEIPRRSERQKLKSVAKATIADNCARIENEYSKVQDPFNFVSAVRRATDVLNDSAKAIRLENQRDTSASDKRCKPCQYFNSECDLQRPICRGCRRALLRFNMVMPCHYCEHSLRRTEEVEVLNLDSDDEGDGDGPGKDYEVESIVARRLEYDEKEEDENDIQYLVKWRGRSRESNSWEPAAQLRGAQSAVAQFQENLTSLSGGILKTIEQRAGLDDAAMIRRSIPNYPRNHFFRHIPAQIGEIRICRLIPSTDTYEYLVVWKSDAGVANSWEAEERFVNCPGLLGKYHADVNKHIPCNTTPSASARDFSDKGLAAGIEVIVANRVASNGESAYCIYHRTNQTHTWVPTSEFASYEAQNAIVTFLFRSKITRDPWGWRQELYPPVVSRNRQQELSKRAKAGAIRTESSQAPASRKPLHRPLQWKKPYTKPAVPVRQTVHGQTSQSMWDYEIATITQHKVAECRSTQYLVQWKGSARQFFFSTADVARFPNGVTAIQNYQKQVRERYAPIISLDESAKINIDWFPERIPTERLPRPVLSEDSGPILFEPSDTCCVQCRRTGLYCEGTTRCERCIKLKLFCVFDHTWATTANSARDYPSTRVGQSVRRVSPQINSYPGRVKVKTLPLPAISKPRSDLKTDISTSRAGGKDHFKNTELTSAGIRSPSTILYNNIQGDGKAVAGSATNVSNVHQDQARSRTSQNLFDNTERSLTEVEQGWIRENVARTAKQLSYAQKVLIAKRVSGKQSFSSNTIEYNVHTFLRKEAEKIVRSGEHIIGAHYATQSVHRKTVTHPSSSRHCNDRGTPGSPETKFAELDKENEEDSIVTKQSSYPPNDRFMVVRKRTLAVEPSRPLPDGYYNRHNVASHVLLALGQHPWLVGLNHHLRGLLDMTNDGIPTGFVSKQLLRGQELKNYKIPTTAAEIKQANLRASLPFSGKPLRDTKAQS